MKKMLFLIFILLLSGCSSPYYTIEVDALKDYSAPQMKSYKLISEEKNPNDLLYRQFAQNVQSVLAMKNFLLVNDEEPEILVYFDYGMSEGNKEFSTHNVPVYGKTGVSSAKTVKTTAADGSVHETTVYTPSYGVVGYKTEINEYETFTSFINLSAYDYKRYKDSGELYQLWTSSLSSTNRNNDIRFVIPMLISASMNYIDTDTRGKQSIKLEIDPNTNTFFLPQAQ